MRIALVAFAIALGGCHAEFIDLRPQSERNGDGTDMASMASAMDLAQPPAPDLSGVDLYGVDFSGVDFSTPPDLSPSPTSGVFAQGTMTCRSECATGTVQLKRNPDGSVELDLLSDFTTGGGPAYHVLLTSRSTIGTAINPSQGDLDLGPLKSDSGEQSYPVPGGDGGRRYAWVYCKTYGIEVGRAPLSP